MEKERKGLLGRLMDFWKEKISMSDTGSIGFWNDTEYVENNIAEIGAVFSLTQEETGKTFWEEVGQMALEEKKQESDVWEQEKRAFFAEENQQKEKDAEKTERTTEREAAKLFATAFLPEEMAEERKTPAFLWEEPVTEEGGRNPISMEEEMLQKRQAAEEAEQQEMQAELTKREEKAEEGQIDIEKLMRQMTKKLWEEREVCGRRLR